MEPFAIIPPDVPAPSADFPRNLPTPPFRMAIYGHSNSGKSVLIGNLLSDDRFGYRKYFKSNIFIFSELISSGDSAYQNVKLPESRYLGGYDEKLMMQILGEQSACIAKHGKKKCPPVLILLDDCVSDLGRGNTVMRKAFFTCRHLNVSLLVTSQAYTALPRPMRINCDTAIFFETNHRQQMVIADEQMLDAEEFIAIFRDATESQRWSFLTVLYKRPVEERHQLRLSGKYYSVERRKD